MKILLVEDDRKLGRATRDLLNYEKCSVDWAEDGNEALNAVKDSSGAPYDVILLD